MDIKLGSGDERGLLFWITGLPTIILIRSLRPLILEYQSRIRFGSGIFGFSSIQQGMIAGSQINMRVYVRGFGSWFY